MKRHWIWILLLAPLLFACEKEEEPITGTQEPQEKTEAQQPAAQAQQPAADSAGEAVKGEPASGEKVDLELGETIYQKSCVSCHDQGIAGAPKTGDNEAWAPRIDKGMDVLVENSIEGFQGNQGVMPPRGGNPDLSDREVASAVAYIVDQSR